MKKIVSILLAAGKGSRCGFDVPKQWKEVDSIPLFEYSLRAFMNVPLISTHILVIDSMDVSKYEQHIVKKGLLTNLVLVVGGKSRQESVYNALRAIKDTEPQDQWPDLVVIHDAARPMVSCRIIQKTIEKAQERGAAIAAAPIYDTVKRVDESMAIIETEPREQLYAAQTPQAFQYHQLMEVHEMARETDEKITDDAMLYEHRLMPVFVVENDTENHKVTTQTDFEYVREWLVKNKQSYMN